MCVHGRLPGIAPSDRDRHPQPASTVHSTRHCVVITSSSAPMMAAPPPTDGNHLRLKYVLSTTVYMKCPVRYSVSGMSRVADETKARSGRHCHRSMSHDALGDARQPRSYADLLRLRYYPPGDAPVTYSISSLYKI